MGSIAFDLEGLVGSHNPVAFQIFIALHSFGETFGFGSNDKGLTIGSVGGKGMGVGKGFDGFGKGIGICEKASKQEGTKDASIMGFLDGEAVGFDFGLVVPPLDGGR